MNPRRQRGERRKGISRQQYGEMEQTEDDSRLQVVILFQFARSEGLELFRFADDTGRLCEMGDKMDERGKQLRFVVDKYGGGLHCCICKDPEVTVERGKQVREPVL